MSAHVLGIDDAPFDKTQATDVPIVGVVMAGAALVEGVTITAFPIDGADATSFIGDWIETMRWRPALHAVVIGGITIAGLGLVDITALASRLDRPVISVTRRMPSNVDLDAALASAGLGDRRSILERTPPAHAVDDGLYVACAGVDGPGAGAIVRTTLSKASVPEPLRLAHMIGAAIVRGSSRGRA